MVEEEEKVSHVAAVEDEHAAEAAAHRACGEFFRGVSAFRQGVSKEDTTPGRYHLYIANNCPWYHRAMTGFVISPLSPAPLIYIRHR